MDWWMNGFVDGWLRPSFHNSQIHQSITLKSVESRLTIVAPPSSDLDLHPEFDHAVGRNLEKLHGRLGVARQRPEQTPAPQGHPAAAARNNRFPAQKIGRLHRLE